MISTRYAEKEDLALLGVLYDESLEEVSDYILTPNPDKCFQEVLRGWATCPQIVLEDEGGIIGFVGLRTVTPAYSDESCIEEYMFYIVPEKRNIKAFNKLAKAALAVADEYKMPLYVSHMIYGSDLYKREKGLRRFGFEPLSIKAIYRGK